MIDKPDCFRYNDIVFSVLGRNGELGVKEKLWKSLPDLPAILLERIQRALAGTVITRNLPMIVSQATEALSRDFRVE